MTALGTLPQPRLVVTVRSGRPMLEPAQGVVAGGVGDLRWWLAGEVRGLAAIAAELDEPPDSPPDRLFGAALARWGPAALPRLRGDFLVVAWDHARNHGFAARDPLGAGGGYWAGGGGALHVATELCDLLAAMPSRPGPDRLAVAQWLSWKALADDRTLYGGVRRLLPGNLLRLGAEVGKVERYWCLQPEPFLELETRDLVGVMRGRIDTTLRDQLRDAQTAALLSGGLDSTGVAGAAIRVQPASVRAYSALFPGFPSVDEQPQIDAFVSHHDVPAAALQVGAGGLLAGTLEHLERWDAPAPGWSDFWERPLLEGAARDGAAAVLSGDGGDELFGMRPEIVADLVAGAELVAAIAAARRLPGMGAAPPWGWIARALAQFGVRPLIPEQIRAHAHRWRSPDRYAPGWLHPTLARAVAASDAAYPWAGGPGTRAQAAVAHLVERQVDATGVREHLRRRAASTGLRGCQPLLDREVVELGLRIPPTALHDPQISRTFQRACIAPDVPAAIVHRHEKPRFDAFLVACLTPADLASVEALLTGPDAQLAAFGDPGEMRAVVRAHPHSHRHGAFGWFRDVLRIAVTETWLRAQEDHTIPRRLLERGVFEAGQSQLRKSGNWPVARESPAG